MNIHRPRKILKIERKRNQDDLGEQTQSNGRKESVKSASSVHQNASSSSDIMTKRGLQISTQQPQQVETIQTKVGRLTIKKTQIVKSENSHAGTLNIVRNHQFGRSSLFGTNPKQSISIDSKIKEKVKATNPNHFVKSEEGKWQKVVDPIQPKKKISLERIRGNEQANNRNQIVFNKNSIDSEDDQGKFIEEEEQQSESQHDEQFGHTPSDEDDYAHEEVEEEEDRHSEYSDQEENRNHSKNQTSKYVVALNNLPRRANESDIRKLIEQYEKNQKIQISMEQGDGYDCLIYLENEESQMRVIKLLHGKRYEGQILRADPAEVEIPDDNNKPNEETQYTRQNSTKDQPSKKGQQREAPALPDSNVQVQQQKNFISQHLKQNDSRSNKPQATQEASSNQPVKQNVPVSSSKSRVQQSSSHVDNRDDRRSKLHSDRMFPEEREETQKRPSNNESRPNREERQDVTQKTIVIVQQQQHPREYGNHNQRQNRKPSRNYSPNSLSRSPDRDQRQNNDRQRSRTPPQRVVVERRKHSPEERSREQRQQRSSPVGRDNNERRRQHIESPQRQRRQIEITRNSNERSSRQPERQSRNDQHSLNRSQNRHRK